MLLPKYDLIDLIHDDYTWLSINRPTLWCNYVRLHNMAFSYIVIIFNIVWQFSIFNHIRQRHMAFSYIVIIYDSIIWRFPTSQFLPTYYDSFLYFNHLRLHDIDIFLHCNYSRLHDMTICYIAVIYDNIIWHFPTLQLFTTPNNLAFPYYELWTTTIHVYDIIVQVLSRGYDFRTTI